jgi:hypothetical protein
LLTVLAYALLFAAGTLVLKHVLRF